MFLHVVFFSILVEGSLASVISGQLTGRLSSNRIYPANTEITEFRADNALRGFTHENGRLKVQDCGYYYIYAQVFFEMYSSGPTYHNRVALTVNGTPFSLMQTGIGTKADYGSLFTGGVIQLHEGDYISLKTLSPSHLWVARAHTLFGAYKIGA